MSSLVLVVNSGSSSIKYRLIDVATEKSLAVGIVERIGLETGRIKHEGPGGEVVLERPVPDHEIGMTLVLGLFAEHGPRIEESSLAAVGHRVVQGGALFAGPALVTDEVVQKIESLSPLAPLHNPANVAGIQAARRAFPNTKHVVVFDTAFHVTLPPAASTYAIDRKIAEQYSIQRYGAHGTSHLFVSRESAKFLGCDLSQTNTIVLHLGNGASVTAVRGGKSVETSMGLTPLEGLVMGTRSGDIDPAVLFHLSRVGGYTTDQLDELLNKKSGMLGLSGYTDMRDVKAAIERGDETARIALDVYVHRIRGYIGAYTAHLGRVDVIAFTAGIGENAADVRALSMVGLEVLGIEIDLEKNRGPKSEPTIISTDRSKVTVLVFPTNEELEIAQQSLAVIATR